RALAPPCCLGLYAVAAALGTGVGRLGFPATLWLQGRYVALASLLWIANAVLMAIGLGMSHEPDRRRHPIALDRVWIGVLMVLALKVGPIAAVRGTSGF